MAVASTGFFDGVHKGHRAVFNKLVEVAKERAQESIAVTFWPHPRIILHQDADKLRLLTSLSEKKALISSLGVDRTVVLPFSKDFSKLTASEFLRLLRNQYDITCLVVGYDHKIGCDGGIVDIEALCKETGIDFIRVKEYHDKCEYSVSSTSVRKSLSSGDVESASLMLGYDYFLSGVVVSGDRIGRTIGFPTANIQLFEPLKTIPSKGVYEVEVIFNYNRYRGICNIGTRPTVSESGVCGIETHILDFDEEIYGCELTIFFLRKIRDEHKFGSLEELKSQIEKDKRSVICNKG